MDLNFNKSRDTNPLSRRVTMVLDPEQAGKDSDELESNDLLSDDRSMATKTPKIQMGQLSPNALKKRMLKKQTSFYGVDINK